MRKRSLRAIKDLIRTRHQKPGDMGTLIISAILRAIGGEISIPDALLGRATKMTVHSRRDEANKATVFWAEEPQTTIRPLTPPSVSYNGDEENSPEDHCR